MKRRVIPRFPSALIPAGRIVVLALLLAVPATSSGAEKPQGKPASSVSEPLQEALAAQLTDLKKLLEAQGALLDEQAKLIEELQTQLQQQGSTIADLRVQMGLAQAAAEVATSQSEHAGQAAEEAQQTTAQLKVSVEELQKTAAELEESKAPVTKLPEWLGRTTFSGTAYFRYSRELKEIARDANEFEFDRVYFIFRSALNDRVSLRFTMEGARRDPEGDFDIATKHFFAEVARFPFASSRFVAGLADLPWVPYEEGIWGYRFQGTVFPDREGYLTSTDLGLGWKVELPEKLGDFHFSVVNGEGWTRPEAGKYKDVHLRLTLTPFSTPRAKNIFLGAFGSTGKYDGMGAGVPRLRQRVILQAGYRGKYLRFMGSYLWANDPAVQLLKKHPSLAARVGELAQARGLSVFSVLNLGLLSEKAEKWELIARYDRLDPDRLISDNEHQRWIFGGSYRWNQYVQTLLDFEQVLVDSGALRPFERRLMLQNEIRF
jgi:hypothetical protein